ncbi:MAG: hypothetical protein RLZZ157_668 [Pseudomonadota bacterium]|jgi:hypothetical protein
MRPIAILASLVLALTATSAFSAFNNVTVKLVTPLAQPNDSLIALSTVWNCAGDTCIGKLDRKGPSVRDCRQLMRAVGPVAAFTVGTKSLDDSGIAACNAAG